MGQSGRGVSQVLSDGCFSAGLLKGDKEKALDCYRFSPGQNNLSHTPSDLIQP